MTWEGPREKVHGFDIHAMTGWINEHLQITWGLNRQEDHIHVSKRVIQYFVVIIIIIGVVVASLLD